MKKSLEHLRRIREHEFSGILSLTTLAPGAPILEIGAGAGWQARHLAELGFAVTALDVQSSAYALDRVWPIMEYEGETLPFADCTFAAVCAFHVLAHIAPERRERFHREVRRVLRPDGVVLFTCPTGTWRFWTNISYYARHWPHIRAWRPRSFLPQRLGRTGNFLSEMYLLSKHGWDRYFRETGWRIATYAPISLFYTGESVLDSALDLEMRSKLARILGGATHAYCVLPQRG